jgi:membrane protein DedA with SNARE-associated domain
MTFAEVIVSIFTTHFYTASFLSGLIGEDVVLFLTFMASHSLMHVRIVFLLAPLGLIIMDTIYFSMGRIGVRKISEKWAFLKRYAKIPHVVVKFEKKRPLLALIFTKFVFSTRIPLMMYVGARGMKYRTFVAYDLIALYVWAAVMIPLAWLAGRGFTAGLNLVKNFSAFLGLAVVFCIVVYAANRIVRSYIIGRDRKIEEVR